MQVTNQFKTDLPYYQFYFLFVFDSSMIYLHILFKKQFFLISLSIF